MRHTLQPHVCVGVVWVLCGCGCDCVRACVYMRACLCVCACVVRLCVCVYACLLLIIDICMHVRVHFFIADTCRMMQSYQQIF